MTTLRVALDASQMLGTSRSVVTALQQMGDGARATGRSMVGLEGAFRASADAGDATRESLRATSGAIQAAGNVRTLVDSLRQVDGSFASIADVAANAAQTILSFGRAAQDLRQLREAVDIAPQISTAMSAVDEFNALFKDTQSQAAASTAAATAISAQAAATSTAAGATGLWTRATLALRAAWAAHPVLLIGSVLAAAATAMAAFASSTRDASKESESLSKMTADLKANLEALQRARAEASVRQALGVPGQPGQLAQAEQQAILQQLTTLRAAGQTQVGLGQVAQLFGQGGARGITFQQAGLGPETAARFQRELERRFAIAEAELRAAAQKESELYGGMVSEAELVLTETDKDQIRRKLLETFLVNIDELEGALRGRAQSLGQDVEQARQQEAARRQAQQGPMFRVNETTQVQSGIPFGFEMGVDLASRQALLMAEMRRAEVLGQINAGLEQEMRLAGMTENARERELAILRIKQEALAAGVELTDTELANIEKMLSAQQRFNAARRAAEYDRSTREGYADRQRLAGMGDEQRRIEEAVAAQRAQAEQEGIPFTAERERFVREQEMATANIEQLRATGEAVGAAIGNSFANAATGVATLRQALAGLLQDLMRIAAQRAIIGPLMDALGGAFTSFAPTQNQQSVDYGNTGNEYNMNNYA